MKDKTKTIRKMWIPKELVEIMKRNSFKSKTSEKDLWMLKGLGWTKNARRE